MSFHTSREFTSNLKNSSRESNMDSYSDSDAYRVHRRPFPTREAYSVSDYTVQQRGEQLTANLPTAVHAFSR